LLKFLSCKSLCLSSGIEKLKFAYFGLRHTELEVRRGQIVGLSLAEDVNIKNAFSLSHAMFEALNMPILTACRVNNPHVEGWAVQQSLRISDLFNLLH
jgi:hypothetical protein